MNFTKIYLLFFILIISSTTNLLANSDINNFKNPPPKIIRTCCGFGYNVKLWGVPFTTFSEVTSFKEIGKHIYLGNEQEHNGIVYTEKGGFIDLGHLRDVADWTYYLFNVIYENKGKEKEIDLGYEGGKKKLLLKIPSTISKEESILMASKIAYELSLWHEIGTWYGTSFVPLIPERYSAFSPEDLYSNLTGASLAIKAIESGEAYETAMTNLVKELLQNLNCVQTREETFAAMEEVNGKWWTNKIPLPSKNVLIKRYLQTSYSLKPWLINEDSDKGVEVSLNINDTLNEMYILSIETNSKFPVKEIFEDDEKTIVTQNDFKRLLEYIGIEIIK